MFVLWDFTKDFKFTTQNEIQSANWNTTFLLERFFHKKFSINRKKFEKWFAESEMSADFGCAHILFEDKASFQLTSRTKSHIHGNVTESHLFCRFLISLSKILKRSIRVCSRFTGKGLAKKMPKLLFLVL